MLWEPAWRARNTPRPLGRAIWVGACTALAPQPARLGLGHSPVAPRPLLSPHAAPPYDPWREAAKLRRREKREIAKLIYNQTNSILFLGLKNQHWAIS